MLQRFKEIDGRIRFFIALFCLSLYFLILLRIAYPEDTEFWENVRSGYFGFCLDVFLMGLVFSIYMYFYERDQDFKRWEEEIKDFRPWRKPEAVYRIVGNIRRLNREGVKKIELAGYYLKKADLSDLNLGDNSSFVGCDLRKSNFSNAILDNVCFSSTKLQGAIFAGASLKKASFMSVELDNATVKESWWFEKLEKEGVAQAQELAKIYEVVPDGSGMYKLKRKVSLDYKRI